MLPDVALSALADINPRRTAARASGDDPVTFIPMSDVSESGQWIHRQTRPYREVRSGYTCFNEGDVLLAKITPCMENGKGCHATLLVGGVGFASTEFHVLRAKDCADAGFVFQWSIDLSLRRKAAAVMTGSSGQQRVPASFFNTFTVPCLPKPEQSKIAEVLSTVDRAIAQTEALIAKQQRIKTGLVQDMLTRGIDEHGQLRSEATHAFKDSPLGRIPVEWKLAKLGDVANISSGITLGKSYDGPDTVELPYLRVANVQDGFLDLSEVKTIRIPAVQVEKYRLQNGDVLMNEGGDFDKLGRGAVWRAEIPLCLHQNHVFKVRPTRNLLLPDFLAHVSSSSIGKTYFVLASKQSTNLASINSTQLKAFDIPLPDYSEQLRLREVASQTDKVIKVYQTKVAKLRLIKTALMQDLLTGKVRVTPLLQPAEETASA